MRIGVREVVRTDYSSAGETVQASFLAGISSEPLGIPAPARRQETRVVEQKVCAYELSELINEELVVIQQGEAYSLNRSPHGILLFMGCMPRTEQLLEVRIHESLWRRSLNLYEVQWTNPVYVESCGQFCFVGCRLTRGPSRYWSF